MAGADVGVKRQLPARKLGKPCHTRPVSSEKAKIGRRRLLQIAAGVLVQPVSIAWTQVLYPKRPVRVIVPFPPGGGVDILARLITPKLGERLGQPFYIENIGGAGGNIGTGQAARAAPDGYTVLFVFGSFVVSLSLFANLPYDPRKDFTPITLAATTPTVLVVNPSLPVQTVKELVGYIRASPQKFSFAHGGIGTQAHLVGEQFRVLLNLDLAQVPFGGSAPATTAVVAGHTPIGFISLAAVEAQVEGSRLRALAVASKTRARTLPNIPTMTEAGFPGIAGDSWVGVLVPAGTPKEIVTILHHEIVQVIGQRDIKERLTTLGYEPVASTPEEFGSRINDEIELWGRVIRQANIKVQ